MTTATTRCRYHCRRCGLHFTSLGGFDSHLKGDVREGRTCGKPNTDIPKQTGECLISTGHKIANVTVYGGSDES